MYFIYKQQIFFISKKKMYFEGTETFSSKKCKYPPGGESNFQFLYQNAQPDQINFNKFPDSKVNYNILNLQATKENCGINCSRIKKQI